jgi:hypothetical protein
LIPARPGNHIKLFNAVLKCANPKFDRDGNKRTAYTPAAYSHLLAPHGGVDIYQIAKNLCTRVEMIE